MPLRDPEFRTDLERMLVYHSWSRGKYLDLFRRLPWRVLTRKRGSTFESIRDVHLHVMGAYSYWLVNYFGQRQLGWVLPRLSKRVVRSVAEMRRIDRAVDAAVQRVARRLGPEDFDRKRTWNLEFHGKHWKVTPREVLWHLIEEDFLHHGEILCMLWQDDIEPPYTGVWWFQYQHDPKRHSDSWHADPEVPPGSAGGYVRKPQAKVRGKGATTPRRSRPGPGKVRGRAR